MSRANMRRRRTTVPQVVTLIFGCKRRSLLMAGDDDETFMTRNLNVTPKTTELHLIAGSDNSVAYVSNNKGLYSMFCTILANYWQARSIARPLCDSGAIHTCFASHEYSTDFNEIWEVYHHQQQMKIGELITFLAKLYQGQGSRIRQRIRIDVKRVLPRSEWLHN